MSHRQVWHYEPDGTRVEGPCPDRRPPGGMRGGRDRARGFSFQLPKNYKYANRFIESGVHKGRPCWTSKKEAEDMCKRAEAHGEDVSWDKGGGLMEG